MQVIHKAKYRDDTKIRSRIIKDTTGTDRMTKTKGSSKDDRKRDFLAPRANPNPKSIPTKLPSVILKKDAAIVCQKTGCPMSRLNFFRTAQGELIKILSDQTTAASCHSISQNKRPGSHEALLLFCVFVLLFCSMALVIEIVSRQGTANRLGVGFI